MALHELDKSVARDQVTATDGQAGQSMEAVTHHGHAVVRQQDTSGQVDVIDRRKATHHVIEELVRDLRVRGSDEII